MKKLNDRRRLSVAAAVLAAGVLLVGCTGAGGEPRATTIASPTPTAPAASTVPGVVTGSIAETTALIERAAAEHLELHELQSLLVQLRVDGEVVTTVVLGDAMSGVPLTADGRFRNGAVAISYVAATMLRMAEEGLIDIDEPISTWAPNLSHADTTTARMLASMTAGYPDHVADAGFLASFNANPFRRVSSEEVLAISDTLPRTFDPGQNWDYSHSGYFALGQVLESAGGAPLDELISRYVLEPLALDQTVNSATPSIPEPVVHGFTAERGFWEDATFWDPSWTLPPGSVQSTSIDDMASGFEAIFGQGTLLSAESRAEMLAPQPQGFGSPVEGCRSCHTLQPRFNYGLGVILQDGWAVQTPLFGGYLSAVATLPHELNDGHSVTVAVAATATEATYPDWSATLPNWSSQLVFELGAALVPHSPPPAFALPTL